MANNAFSDIEFKANAGQFNIDQAQGIVECFVAGIGNKDSVGDVLVTGAFKESLKRRKPRVVWGHNWNDPIGKVLEIYEVPPNDPRLPAKMKSAGIGGLYARVQFNLGSEKGREAFANVAFFGEEQEWSIGYKTLVANFDPNLQANILREVELYEVSPVLHGANQLTGTISVKSDGSDNLADSEKYHQGMPGMPMHQGPKPMGVRPQMPAVMPKPAAQKPIMEDPITVALRRELTKRTGSTVVVREVEDGVVIFDRFTSDGESSTYKVRFGMDDGQFVFGKPERVIARTTYMPANQERSNVVVPSQMPGMPMMVKPSSNYEFDYEKSAQIDSELETLEGLLSESVEEKVGRKINKRNLEKLKSIMEMLHEAIGQAEDVIGAAEKDIDTKSEFFVPVERDQLFHTKSMLDPILDYHRVESYVTEKGIHFSSGVTPEFIEAIDTATKALGRRIGGVGRAVTARFDPNAIDADNDMVVQEGTPFERPGLPNIPGGKPGKRQGGMRSSSGKDTTFILSRDQVEEISSDLKKIRKFSDDKRTIDEIQDRLTGSPMFPSKDGAYQELILDPEEMSRLENALQSGIDNSNRGKKPGIVSSETLSLLGNVEQGGTYDGLKMTGMRSGRGKDTTFILSRDQIQAIDDDLEMVKKFSDDKKIIEEIQDRLTGSPMFPSKDGAYQELILDPKEMSKLEAAIQSGIDNSRRSNKPGIVSSEALSLLGNVEQGETYDGLKMTGMRSSRDKIDVSKDPRLKRYGYSAGARKAEILIAIEKVGEENPESKNLQGAERLAFLVEKTGFTPDEIASAYSWGRGFTHSKYQSQKYKAQRDINSKAENAINKAFAPGRKLSDQTLIEEEYDVSRGGPSVDTYKGPLITDQFNQPGLIVRHVDGSQGIVVDIKSAEPWDDNEEDSYPGEVSIMWVSGPFAEEIGNGPETGYDAIEKYDPSDLINAFGEKPNNFTILEDLSAYLGTPETEEIADLYGNITNANRNLKWLGPTPDARSFKPIMEGQPFFEADVRGMRSQRDNPLSSLARVAAEAILDAKTKDGTISKKQRSFIKKNVIDRIGTNRGMRSTRTAVGAPEPRKTPISAEVGKEVSTFLRDVQKGLKDSGPLYAAGQVIDSEWIDDVISDMKKGSIATNDLEAVKDLLLDDIKDIIRNRDDKSGLEKQQKLTKKVRRLFIGAFDDEEQAQIRRGMGMGETPQLETDKDKFVRGRGMRSARPGQVQRDEQGRVDATEARKMRDDMFEGIIKKLYDMGFEDDEVATLMGVDDVNAVNWVKNKPSSGMPSRRGGGEYEPTEEELADYGKYLDSLPEPTDEELDKEYQDWVKKNGGLEGMRSQKGPNVPEDRKKFIRDWAERNRNFEVIKRILGKEERGEKLSEGDYKAIDNLYKRFGMRSTRGGMRSERRSNETPVQTEFGQRTAGRPMGTRQNDERFKGKKFEEIKPDNWDSMTNEEKFEWLFSDGTTQGLRQVDKDRLSVEIGRELEKEERRTLSPEQRRERIRQMREDATPEWQRRRAEQQEQERKPGEVLVRSKPKNAEEAKAQRTKEGRVLKQYSGVTLDKVKNNKKLSPMHENAWEEISSILDDEDLTRNQIKAAVTRLRKYMEDAGDEEQNDAVTGSMRRAEKLLSSLSTLEKSYKKDEYIKDGPEIDIDTPTDAPDITTSGAGDGGDDEVVPPSLKDFLSDEASSYISGMQSRRSGGMRSQTSRPERAEIVAEATWFKDIEDSLDKEIKEARSDGDSATVSALTSFQSILKRQKSGKTGDKRTNVGTLKLNQEEADAILDAIMVIIDRQGSIGGDKRQQMFAQLVDKIAAAAMNTFMGGMSD